METRRLQRATGLDQVPDARQGWAEDPQLGRGVHNQRQHKKKLDRGEPSERMPAARAAKLEALGFAWEMSRT